VPALVLCVLVVGSGLGIGIGDLRGRRHFRIALTVALEDIVAAAEKDMLNARAAMRRLMMVVVSVYWSSFLKKRRVAGLRPSRSRRPPVGLHRIRVFVLRL